MVWIIYSTFGTKKDAQKCVDLLLSSKLIACSTIYSVESRYVWKGKKVVGREFVTIMKTTVPAKARKALLKIHPYETPCVLSWKVDSNKSYDNWVNSSSK